MKRAFHDRTAKIIEDYATDGIKIPSAKGGTPEEQREFLRKSCEKEDKVNLICKECEEKWSVPAYLKKGKDGIIAAIVDEDNKCPKCGNIHGNKMDFHGYAGFEM